MKTFIINNLMVHSEKETYKNGYIKVVDGKIAEVGPASQYKQDDDAKVITLSPDYQVIPGAIDIHIHGASNSDAMDATHDALSIMAKTLPKEGTTSFLATTMTQSTQAIESALLNAGKYIENQTQENAEIVGVHLEGPFISPARKGAQPEDYIVDPDVTLFKRWQEMAENQIKLVTLAPEQPNGLDLAAHLRGTGVVASIGHSDATYDQIDEAIQAGTTHVTHLYNGMRGLHHREPGVLGAAYLRDELYVELIADGIHCRPEMIKLAYNQITSERMILITDSLRAKWLEKGTYDLGGQPVNVDETKATLSDGTLAGSILKMNDAIKNTMEYTGCSMTDIIKMTAENPAKQLRIFDRKGSIQVGKDADLVILNDRLDVEMTFCRGNLAFKKENV
ncbi:N-acetylglucosamine-6-phosphate deacetylase [Bacillus sp. Soil745]|uniref:N-acetylglucosamine-6-phosphate deacetylase n=1 Tax=Peribacillus frigoritolerans TaxID=450367 RepID=UPI00070C8167|nr:N-acetylglucosamine-6-phosphate deacetylase [Peribacillus frigoritolerans]KRF58794.1 N-acetylglucosamine-6-phosphate deacetylase [Bacillus sp. Soil745]PAW27055.1 N-acetylglucosamine-6-phosphate deacetylase [Peribacillus simplex]MCR8872225.1 N-acetylglucosamine-6-phosphate deacetylase [Peribacillus frigoritolerans]MED3712508.1 N-acetylglucosamine-6-phosphate deacetylase [Peribacillus frigoritolerans]MED3893130.1 N-acetylglucosamine-6-phosphate deacetylase [Peribacillus frigoritolerans]